MKHLSNSKKLHGVAKGSFCQKLTDKLGRVIDLEDDLDDEQEDEQLIKLSTVQRKIM